MTKNINDLSTNIFYSYNKNENNTKKKSENDVKWVLYIHEHLAKISNKNSEEEEESFENIKTSIKDNDIHFNILEEHFLKDNYNNLYKDYLNYISKNKIGNIKINTKTIFNYKYENIKQLSNGIFINYKNNNDKNELLICDKFYYKMYKIFIDFEIKEIYELIENKIIIIDNNHSLNLLSIDKDIKNINYFHKKIELENKEKVQLFLVIDKNEYIISTLEKTFIYKGDLNNNKFEFKKEISNKSYRLGTIIDKKLILINNKDNMGYLDIYNLVTYKNIYELNNCNPFNLSQNCISTIQLNNDEIIVFFCYIKKEESQFNGIFSIKLGEEIIDSFLDTKNFKINCISLFKNFKNETIVYLNENNLNNNDVFDTRYLLVGGNNGIKIYMYKGIIKDEQNILHIQIEFIKEVISENGNELEEVNGIIHSKYDGYIYIFSKSEGIKQCILEAGNED